MSKAKITDSIAKGALGISLFALVSDFYHASKSNFYAKVQTELSRQQTKTAQEVKELQEKQKQADLEHNRLTIDPVRYRIDIPIDSNGALQRKPILELVNSSQRTATELTVEWELVGTDFGSGGLDGWDTILQVTEPPQTLLPGQKLPIEQFPLEQFAVVGKKNKKNPQAVHYYGYLKLTYRDSAENSVTTRSFKLQVYKNNEGNILIIQLLNNVPFTREEFIDRVRA